MNTDLMDLEALESHERFTRQWRAAMSVNPVPRTKRRPKIEIYRGSWIYQGRKQEWRWRFRARNGRILANSAESYVNLQDLIKAIRRVREQVGIAEVVDLTHPNRFPPGYFE